MIARFRVARRWSTFPEGDFDGAQPVFDAVHPAVENHAMQVWHARFDWPRSRSQPEVFVLGRRVGLQRPSDPSGNVRRRHDDHLRARRDSPGTPRPAPAPEADPRLRLRAVPPAGSSPAPVRRGRARPDRLPEHRLLLQPRRRRRSVDPSPSRPASRASRRTPAGGDSCVATASVTATSLGLLAGGGPDPTLSVSWPRLGSSTRSRRLRR